MGILGHLRRDTSSAKTTREAMKASRKGGGAAEERGGALQRLVESVRDVGLDGKASYASAATVARRAQRGRTKPEKAIARVIRSHRRSVTAAGFVTGLGGFITMPVLLPANIFEFYVQATRMVGAIAAIRGHDLDDDEVRARVLACLVGDDADDVLKNVGLGPVAGAAARQVSKRYSGSQNAQIASVIGGRIVRRFGLRSARLFGKAIPGAGAILGAIADRRQLAKIAQVAQAEFPAR